MPSARSAQAAARRQPRPAPRPSRRVARAPERVALRAGLRVRWDRLGRIGLLVVLAVVVGLYAQHTLSYFQTRSRSGAEQAIVHRLVRQNAALNRQQRSLNDPTTIIRAARALGMVRQGEQPYAIIGQPGN